MDQQQLYDSMAATQSRHHHGLGFAGDGTPAPAPAPAAAPSPDIASAAAAAAAIAARISAQLAAGGGAAASPSMSAAPTAPASAAGASEDLSHLTPLERARAIAARLAATMGGGAPATVAGVKRGFGEISGGGGGYDGGEAKRRRKLVVPLGSAEPSQWVGMLVGHGGATHRALEAEAGAKLQLRGRGAPKAAGEPPAPEDAEDLHIVVVADSDEQLARAEALLHQVFASPAESLARLRPAPASSAPSGLGGAAFAASAALGAPVIGSGVVMVTASNGGPFGVPGTGMQPIAGSAGQYAETIGVPNGLVGFIIGRGGENVRDIQGRSGAHIQIQKENDMAPGTADRLIELTGTPPAIQQAKAALLGMVDVKRAEMGRSAGGGMGMGMAGGGMPAPSLGGSVVISCPIPDDRVGIIIGRQGATLRVVQTRHGVHVQVPKDPDADNPRVRTVQISGPTPEACDGAQTDLLRIANGEAVPGVPLAPGGGTTGVGGSTLSTMIVPNDRVGSIIGRGGSNIRELETRFSTRIQLPQPVTDPSHPDAVPPGMRLVKIEGQPASIESVKAEINNLLNAPPGSATVGGGGGGGPPRLPPGYAPYGGGYGAPGYMGGYGGYGGPMMMPPAMPGAYGGGAYGGGAPMPPPPPPAPPAPGTVTAGGSGMPDGSAPTMAGTATPAGDAASAMSAAYGYGAVGGGAGGWGAPQAGGWYGQWQAPMMGAMGGMPGMMGMWGMPGMGMGMPGMGMGGMGMSGMGGWDGSMATMPGGAPAPAAGGDGGGGAAPAPPPAPPSS